MISMEVTVTKEILKPKTKQPLLSFTVKRSVSGVDISLKSKILHDFFSRHEESSYDDTWCGNRPYAMPLVKDHYRNLLSSWYVNLMVSSGYPNLAFLRSTKLKEGASFQLENQVYTRGEIMDFATKFKEEVASLFTEYVKPVTMEVTLITEVREDD